MRNMAKKGEFGMGWYYPIAVFLFFIFVIHKKRKEKRKSDL